MAAKKKVAAKGLGALQAKAAQAEKNATSAQETVSDDYLAEITLDLQQEAAFVREPDKVWDFTAKAKLLGNERDFYWKTAGAGVAGNYIFEMAQADVGGLFAKLVFHRCIHPETGERIFTDKALLDKFLNNPNFSEFVTTLGAEIFTSDQTAEERMKDKVAAAKKK